VSIHIGPRTFGTKLDHGYAGAPEEATLLRMAEEALQRPSDSGWRDSDLWETHSLMFYSAPDADDNVSKSNHRCILKDLGTAYRRSPGAIESASVGHWTYSSFDCIKVRVTYSNGEIHPAFTDAVQIALALEGYPLYSEDDHSELETEDWERAILEAVAYGTEDPETFGDIPPLYWDEVREDLQDWLWSGDSQVAYYQETGYIPDDRFALGLELTLRRWAEARATGLVRPPKVDRWADTLSGI
jgi:hypothetical protein